MGSGWQSLFVVQKHVKLLSQPHEQWDNVWELGFRMGKIGEIFCELGFRVGKIGDFGGTGFRVSGGEK